MLLKTNPEYRNMNRTQKRMVRQKIDAFVDIKTPNEQTMFIANELLELLFPKVSRYADEEPVPNMSVWKQLKTAIINHF